MVTIRTSVITISDTRKAENDLSGARLSELVESSGWSVSGRYIISDDPEAIRQCLLEQIAIPNIDMIVTTGGTGVGPRDNTPEVTRSLIEREMPGLSEAMRRETAKYTPLSMISRAVCGTVGNKLIVNLPGSPAAVAQCFEIIRPVLGHIVDLLAGSTKHKTDH